MKIPQLNLRDPKIRIIAICAAVIVVGSYLWYNKSIATKRAKVMELTNTFDARQKKLNSILAMKPQRDKLQMEITIKQTKLDSLKAIFPDRKEIPKLIHEITRLSQASNVFTTKFNPLTDVVMEYYIENQYNIELRGTYHDFGDFLSRLANLKLIINLGGMKIATIQIPARAGGEEDPGENIFAISATFRMTTFSSKR